MNFLFKRVFVRKAPNLYITIVLQFIICFVRVCKANEFYDFLKDEDFGGSGKLRFNSITNNKNNFSLRPDSKISRELLKNLPIRPGMVQFSSKKPNSFPVIQSSVKRI